MAPLTLTLSPHRVEGELTTGTIFILLGVPPSGRAWGLFLEKPHFLYPVARSFPGCFHRPEMGACLFHRQS